MSPSVFQTKTLRGISWSLLGKVFLQIVYFVIGVILARLLSPREFGLLAMITVFTGFAGIFADFGFGAAIIQKKDVTSGQLSSIFWVNVIAGIILMAVLIGAAPFIALFYHEPILKIVVYVLSINFLLGGLTIMQRTLFEKDINFKIISIIEMVATILSGGTAITLAYLGFGIWSLVAGNIVAPVTTLILYWWKSSWYPRMHIQWTEIKSLLGFSSSLLGFRVFAYWSRNVDTILVGKVMGTNALGIYNKAYSMLLFPQRNFIQVINKVMFPSLSSIQNEKERVKKIFIRVTRTISLVIFPLMLGLFVLADPFILGVYGKKWSGIVPILQVFCLLALIHSITDFSNLYLSQGKAFLQLKVSFLLRSTWILGIVIGLKWGTTGVALGLTIASILNFFPAIIFAGRLVDIGIFEYLLNFTGVFTCAILMALVMWGSNSLLPENVSPWVYLGIQVPLGAVVYVASISVFRIAAFEDFKALLKERLRLSKDSLKWKR